MSENWEFVDFGSGRGSSFNFAASCAPGPGLAVDRSSEAVSQCLELGIKAERNDVLEFNKRNLASAAFAINLMQELPGQAAFRQSLINIVRAATQYIVIQHPYYDRDAALALKGLQVADHFDKKTLFKPTIADYMNFVLAYRESLSLVGIAIYTSGQVEPTPTPFAQSGDAVKDTRIPKTLRVILGRKNVSRFRRALFRAETGKQILLWEGEVAVA
jgi:hypothetical protein